MGGPVRYELGFLEERKIKAAVAEGLREPDSARFVSGRNGFGGMALETPFYIPLSPRSGPGLPWLQRDIAVSRCEALGLFSSDLVNAIRSRW